MKCILTALVLVSSSLASAESLLGQWHMVGRACSSGAPTKESTSHVKYQLDAEMLFTEKQVEAIINLKFQMDKDYADAQIQQLREAIASSSSLPDGEAKTKALAALNDQLKLVELYAAGTSCGAKDTDAYQVSGKRLHMGPTLKHETTCPGDKNGELDQKGYDAVLAWQGKTLRITDAEPETDGETCPKGDRITSLFVRASDANQMLF